MTEGLVRFKHFAGKSSEETMTLAEIKQQTSKVAEGTLEWSADERLDVLRMNYQEQRGFNLEKNESIPICEGLEFRFEVEGRSGRYKRFVSEERALAEKMLGFMGISESIESLPQAMVQPLLRNIKLFPRMMWDNWVEHWVSVPSAVENNPFIKAIA